MSGRNYTIPCGKIKRIGVQVAAFSTGQAARYCYVTADTVLNWIKAGSLEAQRTAGGQYRIRAGALYTFMQEHGMSTELVEAELDFRPYCWEFNCRRHDSLGCPSCPVYRSGAPRCFELRELLPPASERPAVCEACEYFQRHCQQSE